MTVSATATAESPAATVPDAAAPGTAPIVLDADGRIGEDLACVKCRYNLRGADPQGRCPECGLAVGRSSEGHWLRYCDPHWLATIWRGLNCLGFAALCVAALMTLGWSGWLRTSSDVLPEWLAVFLPAALIATASVLFVIGLWLATRRDPARLGDERMLSARRLARLLLIGSLAVVLGMIGTSPYVLWARYDGQLYAGLISGAATAGMLAILVHARGLALRVPAPTLAWVTRTVIAVLGVCGFGLNLLVFDWIGWQRPAQRLIDGQWGGRPGSSPFHHGRDLAETVFGNGLLAGIALLVALLIAYWRVMKAQAETARQTWARRPARSGESMAAGERR